MRFGAPVWADGEASIYRLTDIDGAFAGTATYTLIHQGAKRWTLQREIEAQGVFELVLVEMNETGFRPQSALLIRDDGSAEERVATTYGAGYADLELTTKQDVTTVQRENLPSDSLDMRTLPMVIRTLPLDPAYAARANAFLPIVPRLFRVTIDVQKTENVQVPAGTFDTWPIELDAGDLVLRVWIGTDPPHPLVKLEDGANGATFELIEFRPGSPISGS